MVETKLKHPAKFKEKKQKEEEGTEQRHTLKMSKWDLVGMVGADLKHPAKFE